MSTEHSTQDSKSLEEEKPSQQAQSEGLTRKLLDLNQTRKTIDNFKNWEEDEFNTKITRNDMKRGEIVFLAQSFERFFIDAGLDLMISDISVYIDSIFEISGLPNYADMIRQTLPDKYKNPSKQRFKNISSKISKNIMENALTQIEKTEIVVIDSDSIKNYYERTMDVLDIFKEEFKNRNLSLIDNEKNSNWDTDLKQSEKSRFKKAKVGEPLSTAEQLCEDIPGYADAYEKLAKAMEHLTRVTVMMKEKYTVDFPPLSVESCNRMREGVEQFLELLIPLVDNKHRRDHYQLFKIACQKKVTTSVKASKVSRIPCANHIDPRTGLPVFRGLTKEQIDSMWVQEINFWISLVNTMFGWYINFSAINEEHRVRCLDDRAVDLGPNLTHKA